MSNVMANPSIQTTAPSLSIAGVRRLAFVASGTFGLFSIVVGSFVLRAIGSSSRVAPTLFPDEYIYTAISRSLAQSGRPLIRGESAHFPALLASILAAPVWATVSSTTAAYHFVQAENALFMSLAAVPVYLLARWLDLSQGYALFSALIAVAIPDLVYSGYMLSEPIAYPLALTALYLAMRALERPTLARQASFLAIAGAASFARVQYVVLVPAYLVAAALISRRRTLRAHTVPFALLGLAVLALAAVGSANALGYYSAVTGLHVGLGLVHWAIVDALLLALAGGVAIVPGAITGFASARGPREVACAVLSGTFAAAMLAVAALYASNGSGRFQERYLFALLPLLPIGFGLYLRHGKRGKWLITISSAAGVLLAAATPVSQFVGGTGVTDAPTLRAIARLDDAFGVGTTALAIALYITVAALMATLLAWRRGALPILALTFAFLCVSSAAATSFDIGDARKTFESTSGIDPRWVDEQHVHDIAAIHTMAAQPGPMLEKLFFNRSITREYVLPPAPPTDSFASSVVTIASDGSLLTRAGRVKTPILMEKFGVTSRFEGAEMVAQTTRFALWKPQGRMRLKYLERGRYDDGWLAPKGNITVFGPATKPLRGVLELTILGSPSHTAVPFRIGGFSLTVRPGRHRQLRFCVDATAPWRIAFAGGTHYLPDLRAVSVRSTAPHFRRNASCGPRDLRA